MSNLLRTTVDSKRDFRNSNRELCSSLQLAHKCNGTLANRSKVGRESRFLFLLVFCYFITSRPFLSTTHNLYTWIGQSYLCIQCMCGLCGCSVFVWNSIKSSGFFVYKAHERNRMKYRWNDLVALVYQLFTDSRQKAIHPNYHRRHQQL